MSEASGTATQDAALRTRRAIYFALVGAGLLAGVAGAFASRESREAAPTWLNMLVVAFLLCAAAGLGLIRPQSTPYRFGLPALGGALFSFWFFSPTGDGWRRPLLQSLVNTLESIGITSQVFGLLRVAWIPLFVGAWMLLARSVVGWPATLGSYLGVGLVLPVLYTLFGEPADLAGFLFFPLFWPFFVMGFLGVGGFILPFM